MANILFNFSKSKSGGGKTILDNFIEGASREKTKNRIFIFSPDFEEYSKYNSEYLTVIKTNNVWLINALFPALYFFYFPRLVKKLKIDLIFNFGDVIVPSKTRQIYFFDWAYAVYDDDYVWKHMGKLDTLIRRVKVALIAKYIKKTALVICQSKVMKNRLVEKFKINNVSVIPTPIKVEKVKSDIDIFQDYKNNGRVLFYPATYSPHKNFEIFPELAKLIKEQNLDFQFLLTIDEKSAPEFFELVQKDHLVDQIKFLGTLDYKKMQMAYHSCDAVFIPSLLESYGLPFYEAMGHNIPIITCNLDFALDACQDAANFFDPFDPSAALVAINEAFGDLDKVSYQKEKGKAIFASLLTWPQVFKEFEKSIESILKGG